jgi:CO/xanthine dehydrogenase Mo-binding subunit
MDLTVVGKPVTRVDVAEKVTGQAVYGYDLVLPNMLYGKVLFSPKAHARIKKINLEKAKHHPGVVAVITGEDAPYTHGESIKDKPFLALGKVRYIGEPVAAVAAEDEDTAQDAIKLIEVEYEDLPVYTDPEEACKKDAVAIHEDFEKYRKVNFIVGTNRPNIAEHFKLRTGDVEVGWKQSDLVIEERYFVPIIQHAAMEPHSAHAQFDKDSGRLTLWVANDAPFRALHEISEALNMEKEKIRFINPLQGGGTHCRGPRFSHQWTAGARQVQSRRDIHFDAYTP